MSRNVDHDVFRVSSNRKAFLHAFRGGRLRRWCQCLSHAISFSRSAWERVTDAPRPASNSDATRMTVSQESTIRAFAAQLKQADRKATARYSPGSDIAACGHSVRKENRQKTMTSGLKVSQAKRVGNLIIPASYLPPDNRGMPELRRAAARCQPAIRMTDHTWP